MPDPGVQLKLEIGKTELKAASYDLIDAFIELEVKNDAQMQDGFQITFSLAKVPLFDYGLLGLGLLDPPSRVRISVMFGLVPHTLIEGKITDHEIQPSIQPGHSRLVVTGKDLSVLLELKDKSQMHPNQPDSKIVENILNSHGFKPNVTETKETPSTEQRISAQQCSDLTYIQKLAKRNGFVFYIEPSDVSGKPTAYWGPEKRSGMLQPALKYNMGSESNVHSISGNFDALEPVKPEVSILDPIFKLPIRIPSVSDILPSLAAKASEPLPTAISRDSANLNFFQGTLRAISATRESADAATVTGELDAARYGNVLRARRLVELRGVGLSYDGTYYVNQVTHRIKRGEYKQNFTLKREGRGATR